MKLLLGAALGACAATIIVLVAMSRKEPRERADFSAEGEAKWQADWEDWATDALTEALARPNPEPLTPRAAYDEGFTHGIEVGREAATDAYPAGLVRHG